MKTYIQSMSELGRRNRHSLSTQPKERLNNTPVGDHYKSRKQYQIMRIVLPKYFIVSETSSAH